MLFQMMMDSISELSIKGSKRLQKLFLVLIKFVTLLLSQCPECLSLQHHLDIPDS